MSRDEQGHCHDGLPFFSHRFVESGEDSHMPYNAREKDGYCRKALTYLINARKLCIIRV